MVLDIKMCRFDNVPWGFRLVGGSDFEIPLTVIKVTEDGIAEKAGLCVGDVIVRINDTAVSPLTHDEANKIIKHCGNVFYFGVQRENDDDEEEEAMSKTFPIVNIEPSATPESFMKEGSANVGSEDTRSNDEYLADLCDRPCSVLSERSEIKLVEEEIAAVLSGESEVLKEHNVMGIFPKPGVCMSSDVLRTLNEDATKTKAEKDKENKKWTTFLQKPNRPIPRSKGQIEADRRAANAYKVKIVKSERRSVSPAVAKPITPEPPKEPSPPKPPTPPTESPQEPVEEEAPPTDSEVPNLEGTTASNTEAEQSAEGDNAEETETNEEEKADKEKESSPDAKETSPIEQMNHEANADSRDRTPSDKSPPAETASPKTAEELALARQLADVQKQLQALSSLPSTIQATLDAVTKQLGELLPTFKLQQVQLTKQEPREINLECIEETKEETKEKQTEDETAGDEQEKDVTEEENKQLDVQDSNREEEQDSNLARDIDDYYEESTKDPAKQQANLEYQEETRQMEEEQNLKKQKRHDVIEELEEHLERKSNPKQQQRSKRAFGPLTPSSERPLVLPGGRRWYRPKDAYNDEFIAETLSAQAELITGTTLGVNFMKYQKPERKIDLDRSEVYKIIHHLDRQPVRGIEVRAPVVPAAVDIRKAVK